MAKLAFDANKVAPQAPLGAIPKDKCDWVLAKIIKSEVKPTAKEPKEGRCLHLVAEILAGEFKGRRVFDQFNTANKNPIAQEIGQGQLSALCHATGAIVIADTNQLHDKPFELLPGYEAESGQYKEKNYIAGMRAIGGAASSANTTPAFVKPNPAAAKPVETKAEVKPAPKAPPAAPKKPVAPPPPKVEPVVTLDARLFWVDMDGTSEERTGEQLREMLAAGMPAETAIQLQEGQEGHDGEWRDAAFFGIGETAAVAEPEQVAETPAPTPPPAPAAKRLPWKK